MAFLRTKGGNFAYAATRVRVRKSFLFTRETYLKLLQMSLPEISRFIGESKYKQEIDELATKYSGIDLLEYALNLNLARDLTQVQGFCQGELHGLIGAYLMRWDVWNIKSIMRGKFSGASDEEIRATLVPAGSIRQETLNEMVKKANIQDMVEDLSGTIFYKPLLNAMDSYNKTHVLSDIENSLDKAYYGYMASLPVQKANATALFINFIHREIDFTNLRTLFRLKRAGLEYDKIMDYMIPGGAKLKPDDLRKLAQAPSFDEFVNALKEYPYWADLSEAVENYRETNSLNEVEIALYKGQMGYANKISHLYPLSVTPILGYVINKTVEINNLRTIARGKEMHLSDETIKSQLVI